MSAPSAPTAAPTAGSMVVPSAGLSPEALAILELNLQWVRPQVLSDRPSPLVQPRPESTAKPPTKPTEPNQASQPPHVGQPPWPDFEAQLLSLCLGSRHRGQRIRLVCQYQEDGVSLAEPPQVSLGVDQVLRLALPSQAQLRTSAGKRQLWTILLAARALLKTGR